MPLHGVAAPHRHGGKAQGILQRKDRLGKIPGTQPLGQLWRSVAQNQHRQADPRLAQLLRLLQIGNRQPLRPKGLVLPGQHCRPVAVGVRLHYAAHFHAWVQPLPDLHIIMRGCIQIDLCPNPFDIIRTHIVLLATWGAGGAL